MFEIALRQGGKRYNAEWIFRALDLELSSGESVVFIGGNGSGKSTALRTLLGFAPLSEGELNYRREGKPLKLTQVYPFVSYCAPYLDLYEELTLSEFSKFHFSLKRPQERIDADRFARHIGLEEAEDKPLKFFSSGMKQRVRLGAALFSDTKVVFLDEPTVNLDSKGIEWYAKTVEEFKKDRILVVASNNQESEFFFCDRKISIEDYRPA